MQLEGYVNASWADNPDDRRSTCGLLFSFGGGLVFWKSGRQSLVAHSTTESEYIALSVAAREAAALRRLVLEVLQQQHGPIEIYEDNQPAIDLLQKPPGADSRTKHMDVRFHYIRQEVNRGAITVVKIPTEHQAADGLTKPLDRSSTLRSSSSSASSIATALSITTVEWELTIDSLEVDDLTQLQHL